MPIRVPVPVLLKHNTLALFKAKLGGDERWRFASAYNIAVARLVEYGFLRSETSLKLTGKGVLAEKKHRHDAMSASKSARFDFLYLKYLNPPPKTPTEKHG